MSCKVRVLVLCLVVSVAVMGFLSSSSNYVNAVQHPIYTGSSPTDSWSGSWSLDTWSSWASHSWSWSSNSWGSWTSHTRSGWSSHTWGSWSPGGITTVYTGYNGGNYYSGGYYYNGGNYNNGGYYPNQDYCNPYSPSYYCYGYYPSYPYQVQTATTTFTQENYVTEMVTSTASVMTSVMMPTTFTSILMVTTVDNSAITFYGIIIAALLIVLGALALTFMFLISKFKMTESHPKPSVTMAAPTNTSERATTPTR